MATGLRLGGNAADVVALSDLLTAVPSSMVAHYRVYRLVDGSTVLLADTIEPAVAMLRQRGHDVVEDVPELGGVMVGNDLVAVDRVLMADGLLAAIPTQMVTETELPDEVLFVVDGDDVCTRLLETLLLLGRDDAMVGRLVRAQSSSMTVVRLRRPPWWVLSRVSDGDEAGIWALVAERGPSTTTTTTTTTSTSTILAEPAPLYVQHGRRHPLSRLLSMALAKRQETGLLWSTGVLERVGAPWVEHSIQAAIVPTMPASSTATTSTMEPTTERFGVQLRLGHGGDDNEEPELFVVDSDTLVRLQSFVDEALPDELDRVVLGRLSDSTGRSRTVVRELVRASAPRLGARLQSILSVPGHVRVPGVDGLYLPVGRRLVPMMRPRALRELLGLTSTTESSADHQGADAVVVDEDSDGLRLTALTTMDAEPLSKLSTHLLTDRRTVYDRLIEDAVLAFPGVQLQRPARLTPPPPQSPRIAAVPVAVPPRPALVPPTTISPVTPGVEQNVAQRSAALQQQEAALQTAVLGSIEDAELWRRLARIKLTLRRDDVVSTVATALFLGAEFSASSLSLVSPDGPPLSELVAVDRPTHAQATRLCIEVLRVLQPQRQMGTDENGGSERVDGPANDMDTRAVAVDDDLLHQATRTIMREDFPVPRRLQWTTLLAIARHCNDPIGLTRAKEAMLGAINSRGLTEALDLPRFVRSAVAMAELDDGDSRGDRRARSERLAMVEHCLAQVVPQAPSTGDGRAALLRAIFSHGLARLGGNARELINAIDVDVANHDPPVQILLRLYSARVAFVLTRSEADEQRPAHDAAWKSEVQQVLQSAARPEDRRVAEWLIKRSAWLRHDHHSDAPTGLRPSLLRLIHGAVEDSERGVHVDVPRVMANLRAVPGCYDFEIAAALERLLDLALLSGRDDVIARSAAEGRDAAGHLRILAHRARLLGACVKAAAIVDDRPLVEHCLSDVSAIAGDPSVPSVRDLLLAIRPALLALRRVGANDAARRFLSAFVPLTTTTNRETGPLSAALAQGFLQVGDHAMATELLQRGLQPVWLANTPHIDRFEAGLAVMTALVHWPADERFRLVERVVERLDVFTDTFTTSRWFPTHQVLLAERIVDTLVDNRTVSNDALHTWLDDDEARVRRRIWSEWRQQMTG